MSRLFAAGEHYGKYHVSNRNYLIKDGICSNVVGTLKYIDKSYINFFFFKCLRILSSKHSVRTHQIKHNNTAQVLYIRSRGSENESSFTKLVRADFGNDRLR